MKNPDQIRIGILGGGNIGRVHIEHFARVENAKIVAVADAFPAVAAATAGKYEIGRVSDSPEAMLLDPEIDAVVIAAPNRFHAPYAIMALDEGKHVFLEKPMATSGHLAKEIVRAARRSERVLMVGHQMRFDPVPMELHRRIVAGEAGKVYYAKAGWLRRKGIPGWGSWFTRKEDSGGGVLIDLGVHLLDLALWLMGSAKPVRVKGAVFSEFGPKKRGLGEWGTINEEGWFDVDDSAFAQITMEDGAALSLELSWAAHVETDNTPYIQIFGSDAGMTWRGNSGQVLTERDGRTFEEEIVHAKDEVGHRMRISREFISAIQEGRPTTIPPESGMANNLVIDAIYQSAQEGREVAIDWTV